MLYRKFDYKIDPPPGGWRMGDGSPDKEPLKPHDGSTPRAGESEKALAELLATITRNPRVAQCLPPLLNYLPGYLVTSINDCADSNQRLSLARSFSAVIKATVTMIDRWRNQFNAFLKALKPNCAYSAGNVCPRREFLAPFDWRSGDFFSPGSFHLHDMARMMRWYGTLGIPYDAYVCDTSFTHVREKVRSRSKSTERMLQEAATIAANGGGVGYWTYPLGNGALVPSRMENARAVQQFLTTRRHVFQGTQSIPWTLIAVTDRSKATAAWCGKHLPMSTWR